MFFLEQRADTTDDNSSDKPSDESSNKPSDKTGKMPMQDVSNCQMLPLLMWVVKKEVEDLKPLPEGAQWTYAREQWKWLLEHPNVADLDFDSLKKRRVFECVVENSPEELVKKTQGWPFTLDLDRDKEGLAQHGAGESDTKVFVAVRTSIHCRDWTDYSSRSKPEWTIEAEEVPHNYKIAGVPGKFERHLVQVKEGRFVKFFTMPFGATAMQYELGSGVKVFMADVSTPDQSMPTFDELARMYMAMDEKPFDPAPHTVGEFSSFRLEISAKSTNEVLCARIHDRTIEGTGAGGLLAINSQTPLLFEASMVAMVATRGSLDPLSDAPYQFYRVVDGELAFCLFVVVSIHGVPLFMGLVDQTSVPGSADF